ncbi:MAG: hypothetical protein WCO78_00680 [Candidatus Roizmanbacteria bacterium]
MSLLTSIFQKKPKRDLFHGLLLTESGFVHYIFEKTPSEINIDYEDSHTYTQKFEKVLDDVDEALFEAEKRLSQKINSIIFFVPTYSVEVHNKEVSQPYRRAISEIVKNLELEAMGYIEIFDIFKSSLSDQPLIYIESDISETLIGTVSDDTLDRRVMVKTDAANISSKVRKMSTHSTRVLIRGYNQSIVDQITDGLDGYTCAPLSHTDFNLGLLQILQNQLLGITEDKIADSAEGEVVYDVKHEDEVVPDENIQSNTEVVYSKHTLTLTDDSSESPQLSDAPLPAASDVSIQTQHLPKHGDVVKGFRLHHSAKTSKATESAHRDSRKNAHLSFDGDDAASQSLDDVQTNDLPPSKINVKTKSSINFSHIFGRSYIWLIGLMLIIVASISLLSVYEYVFHIVKIEISMPTRTYEKEIVLMGIPVTKSVEEKEVTADIPTTGKIDIGERAKGQISILNFQNKVASLSAGTKLTSNGHTYQLDSDVIVDAAKVNLEKRTIEAASKTVPGSATGIGPEANLDKNAQLAIVDVSSSAMAGIVDSAITGGTSKTVSAVASADIKSLRLAIAEKAKVASTSLLGQKPQDSLTLDSISKVDVGDIDFSGSAGDVASQLNGTARVNSELYSVQKAFIEQKAHAEMIKSDPYAQSTEGVGQYTFKEVNMNENGETVDLILVHQTKIFTSIPVDQIKSRIKPALIDTSVSTLKNELKAARINVVDVSAIKLWGGYLPLFKKNIDVSVIPEK